MKLPPDVETEQYETTRAKVLAALIEAGCTCPEPKPGLVVTTEPLKYWRSTGAMASNAACSKCGYAVLIPQDVEAILRSRMAPPAW